MEEEALNFLLKFKDWIKYADLLSWLWQTVCWAFTKFMYILTRGSEEFLNKIFLINDFLKDEKILRVYRIIQAMTGIMFVIALIVLGLKMIGFKKINVKDVFFRMIIYTFLIVNMPAITNFLQDMAITTFEGTKEFVSGQGETDDDLSFLVVKSNMADLAYLGNTGFAPLEETDGKKNAIEQSDFLSMSLNDIITPSDAGKLKNEEGKYLAYRITYNLDQEQKAEKIKNGLFSFFKAGTFRYPARFGVINMSLIALIVFNILMGIKLLALFIDILFRQMTMPFLAAPDLETGEKMKAAFEGLVMSFATIALLGLSRSLFILYFSFLQTLNWNWIGFGLAGIGGALFFIKGSDAVAKQFGVDVGLKDGAALVGGAIGMAMLKRSASKNKQSEQPEQDSKDNNQSNNKQGALEGMKQRVKSGTKSVGQLAGAMSEGGVRGLAGAGIENVGEKAQNTAQKIGNKVSAPFRGVKEAFDNGYSDGLSGMYNRRAQEQKPTIPDDVPKGRTQDMSAHEDTPDKNISKEKFSRGNPNAGSINVPYQSPNKKEPIETQPEPPKYTSAPSTNVAGKEYGSKTSNPSTQQKNERQAADKEFSNETPQSNGNSQRKSTVGEDRTAPSEKVSQTSKQNVQTKLDREVSTENGTTNHRSDQPKETTPGKEKDAKGMTEKVIQKNTKEISTETSSVNKGESPRAQTPTGGNSGQGNTQTTSSSTTKHQHNNEVQMTYNTSTSSATQNTSSKPTSKPQSTQSNEKQFLNRFDDL